MHALLDTNIYLADPGFDRGVATLCQFLRHTRGTLVQPETVMIEVPGVYRRKVEEAVEALKKSRRELSRLNIPQPAPDIDVDATVAALERRLDSPLPGLTVHRPPTAPGAVAALTRLAVARKRPFNNEGHGFRDAAIWLALLNHARTTSDTVAFVSANTRDFADSDGAALHPDLRAQLESEGIANVTYYKSVADFVSHHLTSAAFNLQPYLALLTSSGLDLEPFSRRLGVAAFDGDSGRWLALSDAPEFEWEAHSHHPYQVGPNELYVRIEATAEVEAEEVWISGVYTDDARDETYEDTDSHPVRLMLGADLALRVIEGQAARPEILEVRYLGHELF